MGRKDSSMVKWQGAAHPVRRRLAWKLMTGVAVVALTAGCAKTGKKDSPQKRLAAFDYSKQARRAPLKPNNPLHIATAHWARKHQKSPADPTAALNYARNLKALGAKDKAFQVLARSYDLNKGDPQLASEYGRLALDMGKVQLAEQLLNTAQHGRGKTDWRVLSALGTLNAKRGEHKKAQTYYLAALRDKPDATSVFNNLALSYALDGRVGDAEDLLKRAVAKGHNTRRVRQNLALVLGLQSKFGEAQQIAQADLDTDKIDNNVTFMRSMVKTQVAKAGPKKTGEAKADAITTASIPTRKPAKAITVAKAPAKAKQAPVTKVVKAAPPAPERKPAKPENATKPAAEKPTQVALATSTKQVRKDKNAPVLPWHKKSVPAAAQTGKKVIRSASASPTSLLPQGASAWSTTVTAAAPAEKAAEPAPVTKKPFKFPAAE